MALNDQLPDKAQRQAIEAEAARLVALSESGDDPATSQEAMAWMSQGPYHPVAYAAALDTWRKSQRLRLRADVASPVDDDPAVSPDDGAGRDRPRFALSRRQVVGGSLAAGLSVAVGLGLRLDPAADRRVTAFGQRETARLADGSSIRMNSETAMDVVVTGRKRHVRLLRGEAMFDIARDPDRPFTIDMDGAEVRVLGTKFNLRRKGDITELAVTEGSVSVVNNGVETAIVKAGTSALIRPGVATTLVTDPALIQQRLAWTEGLLEFDSQPLDEVIEEVNRYRKVPMVIGDPRIAGTLVTGRFGIDEGDEFVAALKSSFGIQAREGSDGTLVLMKAD